MLSVYTPPVSVGSNANPQSCIGDSLYEWVVNNSANTLVRVRKDTYVVTDTISVPINCANITSGVYQGNNYIFTSSGSVGGLNGGYIVRVMSDSPSTTFNMNIFRTYTGGSGIVFGTALVFNNGYLWLIPNNASNISPGNTPVIRLNIFNNLNKTTYSYNTATNTTDSEVTVFTDIASAYNASQAYIFGSYLYSLSINTNTSPFTTITKMSISTASSSGIVQSQSTVVFSYGIFISAIASDNVNYIWMAENSSSSGRIYRMSLSQNTSIINEPTPTTAVISFLSTLKSITAMKYGAGYLWITGKTITANTPALVQVDVTNNTIINTIPLISNPVESNVTNIDIYSEYMWMTDNANSALLKMKIYIPCFREGTKLLCLTPQMKEEYVPIQNIRKGHLVKTSLNGYVPVCIIGKSSIANPGGDERIKNRLYKCTKDNYPELLEDLYITGCHSILVNELTEIQREKTIESLGNIYITDRKYRLMAYLDDRAEPYDKIGTFTIWHLALENDDYYMNYGIYANGLLVESTSKRYMKELSGMELV